MGGCFYNKDIGYAFGGAVKGGIMAAFGE